MECTEIQVYIGAASAIVGALIGGFFSYRSALANRDAKELSIKTYEVKQLLSIDKTIEKSIEISMMGKAINSLGMIKFSIANKGNATIENINPTITTSKSSSILTGKLNDDIRSDGISIEIFEHESATVHIDFLNRNDVVSGFIIVDCSECTSDFDYRQKDVKVTKAANVRLSDEDLLEEILSENSDRSLLTILRKYTLAEIKRLYGIQYMRHK